jgi:hypothetical protein
MWRTLRGSSCRRSLRFHPTIEVPTLSGKPTNSWTTSSIETYISYVNSPQTSSKEVSDSMVQRTHLPKGTSGDWWKRSTVGKAARKSTTTKYKPSSQLEARNVSNVVSLKITIVAGKNLQRNLEAEHSQNVIQAYQQLGQAIHKAETEEFYRPVGNIREANVLTSTQRSLNVIRRHTITDENRWKVANASQYAVIIGKALRIKRICKTHPILVTMVTTDMGILAHSNVRWVEERK